ncbi:conserved hypothetical protein [Candidatus Methylobacter favarea]|uniref:PilZ domain-containing protein n=2 Tax=Candidatus Methylobacter favarea TaxID=2707345 RepID=A0A8S0WBC7_9GAMM|nr:conserved hypothetical protein [Candidatus Methylobacter favarea]
MFAACPVLKIRPLPFAIDEIEFSVWLKTLTATDAPKCCKELMQVLKALNNHPMPDSIRLFFLEKLEPVLFRLTDRLIPGSVPESPSLPLLAEHHEIEIAVWACAELANGYALLSREESFRAGVYSVPQKSLIISHGLQALGKALLHISQTYKKPYAGFWLNCFQFYRLAQQNNLTTDAAASEAQAIDKAFKHILVFSLSNSNQFSPSEMRAIYDLLSRYSEHAKLLSVVPEKKFKGIPCIYLDKNLPPAIPDPAVHKEDENTLYIATVEVAGKILEASSDKNLHACPADKAMLLRLAKTLTLNPQRKYPRKKTADKQFGIIGFNDVIFYLRKQALTAEDPSGKGLINLPRPGELRELHLEIINPEQKSPTMRQSEYSSEQAVGIFTFDEAPLEVTRIDPEDIWNSRQKKEIQANIKLVDASEKGFGLIWISPDVQLRIGDILGLQNKDFSLAIGVIRRLAQSEEFGLFAGVEMLGINPQAIEFSNPGYPDSGMEAIYLPGEETESIILSTNNFRPAEFIFIYKAFKKIRYRITRHLTATALINQFAVVKS